MLLEKWCPPSIETLDQSPACRMDTREMPAAKATEAAGPQREPTDISALATQRTSLPKKK